MVEVGRGGLEVVSDGLRRLSMPVPRRLEPMHREVLKVFVDVSDDLLVKPVLDDDPFLLPGENVDDAIAALSEKGEGRCDTCGPYRHLYNPVFYFQGTVYDGPRTLVKLAKMLQSGSYLTVQGEAVPVVDGAAVEVERTKVEFKVSSLKNIKGKNVWGGLWVQSLLYKAWYRVTTNNGLKTVGPPEGVKKWDDVLPADTLVDQPLKHDKSKPILLSPNLVDGIVTLLTRIASRYRSDSSTDPPTRPIPLTPPVREELLAAFPLADIKWAAPELCVPPSTPPSPQISAIELLSYLILYRGCPTTLEHVLENGCDECFLVGTVDGDDDIEFVHVGLSSVVKERLSWRLNGEAGECFTAKQELATDDEDESEEEVEEKGKRKSCTKAVKKPTGGARRKWEANEEKAFTRPQEMFDDIAKRIEEMWPGALEELEKNTENRKIRVATMCSGTEAPLLALNMFERAFGFKFCEHVFSCEIEPFKQAYIERNFSPKILFRDIRELCNDSAHTAYGALVPVPGNVDILVAGTVCKDFSNLNKFKKGLDDDGQSGMTFRGMLGWVAKHQPKVIILENVSMAPWGEIVASFNDLKLPNGMAYKAQHIKVDTKRHYIPQTRERGYLCATLGRKDGLDEWAAGVRGLECFAAANVTEFMLKDDDPMVVRARRRIVKKEKRDVNWQRCELRHAKERAMYSLGQQRPLTKWDGKGHLQPVDWFWHAWLEGLTERVHDTIEIRYLRSLSELDDALYRNAVWNLACNVDRGQGCKLGIVPCLTPTMIPFLTCRGGPLIGAEALALQGIPVDDLILTQETEKQLKDLAGNAMTTTVVGTCIMSAILTVYNEKGNGAKKRRTSTKQSVEVDEVKEDGVMDLVDETIQIELPDGVPEEKQASLLAAACGTALKCSCEAFEHPITPHPLYQCSECGYTACAECKGNPTHQYSPVTIDRPDPRSMRDALLAVLPASCRFASVGDAKLEAKTFKLSKLRRVRKWVAEYYSHERSYRADAVLEPGVGLTWRVYCLRDHEVDPIVIVDPSGASKRSSYKSGEVVLKGEGYNEAWPVQLGVRVDMPEVPTTLEVTAGNGVTEDLKAKICGTYKLLPTCGGPYGILFKRVEGGMYFFPDLTPVGKFGEDEYCFAEAFSRVPDGYRRLRVAATEPGWKLSEEKQVVKIRRPDYVRKEGGRVVFNYGMTLCSPKTTPSVVLDSCTTSFVVSKLLLSIPLTTSTQWVPCHTDDMSWAVTTLTLPSTLTDWTSVSSLPDYNPAACESCNPQKPGLNSSGVEDGKEAAKYERALKARPGAFIVEKRLVDGGQTEIRVSLNPVAMMHRAAAMLGAACKNTIGSCEYQWRVVADEEAGAVTEFALIGNKGDKPYGNPPKLNRPHVLRKEQLRSLSWMVSREMDTTPFIRQEVATGTVSGWTLEGKVTSPITVQGGVLADEVGYGKTVVSLSLIASKHTTPIPPSKLPKDSQGKPRPYSNATLVIVPPHLMGQWPSEIEKFLPASVQVYIINTKAQIDAVTSQKLCDVDIVLLSSKVLAGARLNLTANPSDNRQYYAEYEKAVNNAWKRGLKLEYVVWKRIIVDEYTFLNPDQAMVVSALTSQYRWLLSGTPDTSNFNEVKKIGDLLQVHLGMTEKFKLTEAEKFHKLRTVEPPIWHVHRNGVAQRFLNIFVRKNIAEIDELPIRIETKISDLSKVHSVVYQELESASQQYTFLDGAEALLHGAATLDKRAYDKMLNTKIDEIAEGKKSLKNNLEQALGLQNAIRTKTGDKIYCGKFENWEQGAMAEDSEVADVLKEVIRKAVPKKVKAAEGESEMKFNLDELTHKIRSIAGKLVTEMRSVRFMKQTMARKVTCEAEGCGDTCQEGLSISSMCGHVSHTEHLDRRMEAGQDKCPVAGCAALVKEQYLYSFDNLNEREDSVATKIEQTVALVKSILSSNKTEQIVVFAQFPSLTSLLKAAFTAASIRIGLVDTQDCLQTLSSFTSGTLRVLLLTLDVNSSGLNLFNARNAIFFHPIVASTPIKYEALQRQAIGRVHRYGQAKEVRVYHMLADKTIDTRIFKANRNLHLE